MASRDEDDFEVDVTEGLQAATKVAGDVFGPNPTTSQTFFIYDVVVQDATKPEEVEELVGELKKCRDIAAKVFGGVPTEDQIIGIYDRLFAEDDDE